MSCCTLKSANEIRESKLKKNIHGNKLNEVHDFNITSVKRNLNVLGCQMRPTQVVIKILSQVYVVFLW